MTHTILKYKNNIIILLVVYLISFQTIYHFYNSIKEESTFLLMSSAKAETGSSENELDETELIEFVVQNNTFRLNKFCKSIFINNSIPFLLSSFHQRVPIPPPEV